MFKITHTYVKYGDILDVKCPKQIYVILFYIANVGRKRVTLDCIYIRLYIKSEIKLQINKFTNHE